LFRLCICQLKSFLPTWQKVDEKISGLSKDSSFFMFLKMLRGVRGVPLLQIRLAVWLAKQSPWDNVASKGAVLRILLSIFCS